MPGSPCLTRSRSGEVVVSLLGDCVIVRGRFRPQQRETGKRLRVNDQIRTSPVRLIDENNEQIGVVEIDDAKRRARAAGLDLVEVAANSSPPVCRIMDFGKWKYQQRKKEQKARSHSKHSELKEVRLRPKIDGHDLMIKTEKARQFLTDGDKVQFTLQFRGREMAHQELGLKTMHQVRDVLAPLSKVEIAPRMAGRRMTMVLAPDQRAKVSAKPKNAPPSAPTAGEKPSTGSDEISPPVAQSAVSLADSHTNP